MTVETLDTTASSPWTCPAGVTSIDIECWGAGANGTSGDGFTFGGNGGGGGAYAQRLAVAVTPGNTYSFVVDSSGGASETNWDSGVCVAKSAIGTTGGLGDSGVGDVRYSGGNGAASLFTSTGGGGGGAGGPSGVGGVATTSTGGNGNGAGAGDGGDGKSGSTTGATGKVRGGGGGGGGPTGSGGPGARGGIKLTYTAEEDVVLLLADDDGFAGVMNAGCGDIFDGYG